MKQNYSNSGCFSGIFRRMLCTGKVPTHPSSSPKIPHSKTISKFNNNNIPQKNTQQALEKPESGPGPGPEPKPGPNLMARLMGLDSLPPSANLPPKSPSRRDSFSRSRSVNFADYLLNFDAEYDNNSRSHRRVRTSVSFREVPGGVSFNEPPSGEFVVVYLESNKPEKETNKKKKKKKKSNNTERERQCAKTKNDKDDKASKLIKNEPRRKVLPKASSTNSKVKNGGSNVKSKVLLKRENEKKVPEKFARKRKTNHGIKKVRLIQSNTQKLSPDGHPRTVNPDLKVKTKSREQKIACHGNNDEFELRSTTNKNNGSCTDNKDALDFTELAELLLKLTEEDLSESDWFSNTKNSSLDFEDICIEFEELILDVLLNELASEIVHI